MLIRNAEIWRGPMADVRIKSGRIAAIGALAPLPGESLIDAKGAALLPGLHDHHIHLAATAAAMSSVMCGPPDVEDADALADALAKAAGAAWLRGIGYHESVAGMLCRQQLDEWVPHRPVRIQHRSGRMWFLNSPALAELLDRAPAPPGLERKVGDWTGRLFDEDAWLRSAMHGTPPDLTELGQRLSRQGVTGVTDMSPSNADQAVRWLSNARIAGFAPAIVVAGSLALDDADMPEGLATGPVKFHLHEHALPDLDAMIELARRSHQSGRARAVHCTTEVELVFALAILRQAGPIAGDRIEHAGIAPDSLIEQIADLGLQVVSQPAFIDERGDQYLADVQQSDWPHLYRLRAFKDAGVGLAAGSDAPYGTIDPWAAMRAACTRRTRNGQSIGPDEALTPEESLALFLADPLDLGGERRILPGMPADLCLLDRPWQDARSFLDGSMVRATISQGRLVHDAVDKAPVTRRFHADATAG